MNLKLCLITLVICSGSISYCSGQVKDYQVPFASVSPLIDGHADFIWSKPYWSSEWKDIVSSEAGLYRTRFKALWDKKSLYFFFEVVDPDIKASGENNHEPLFQFDNIIEVFLDPHGDQKNYYELQINAKETRWELTLDKPYKDGGEAKSPDELEGLKFAVILDGTLDKSDDVDHGWYVELSIPWSSLPDVSIVPPQNSFMANFSRVFQDDDDLETSPQYWLWQPIGEPNIHIPDKWGTLTFKSNED